MWGMAETKAKKNGYNILIMNILTNNTRKYISNILWGNIEGDSEDDVENHLVGHKIARNKFS